MAAINQEIDKRAIWARFTVRRASIVQEYPFYGDLLMHLHFALGNCGTAGTDMKNLIFDPVFFERLKDDELDFVLLHETLHCALLHPIRGKEFHHHFYNLAADIVINSMIMEALGLEDFVLDGEEVMHRTPSGEEGRLFTTEEVYEQLREKYKDLILDVETIQKQLAKDLGVQIDEHKLWDIIPLNPVLSEEWKDNLKTAIRAAAGRGDVPGGMKRFVDSIDYKAKLRWKEILHDFIQLSFDTYDYSFCPNDRRFSDSEFILPAFGARENEKIENVWFVVDTSGSISDEMLAMVLEEVKASLRQFDNLQGLISYFDMEISEPVSFGSVEDLEKIAPVGGGGTSFHCIFQYMQDHMSENLPNAVLILTDGYADFPDEEMAMNVPVLWLIVGSEVKPPWGMTLPIPE